MPDAELGRIHPPRVSGGKDQTGYLIFYLEFSGFDVPKGYSGVDGKPVRQVGLEAHQLADDPLNQPCTSR